jgi:hypothetical protein
VGQSAEELRQEIAETRGDLGVTVDAITDHVSPSRVMAHQKDRLASRWTSVKESVMGSAPDLSGVQSSASGAADTVTHLPESAVNRAQGQPVMAGVIAFGLGFLAAAVFPGSQTEGQIAQRLQEASQPVADELKQAGQGAVSALKEPARDAAEQLKDSATSGAARVREVAQDAAQNTADAASDARDHVTDQAAQSAERVKG